MDKTLHNQIYGGISRSPFQGTRTRQSSGSSYSTSGRKTLGAAGASPIGISSMKKSGAQSRFSVSGRSNQTIVGVRSECSVVESYGFQLPVLVNEALTFSEKNQSVSVTCAQNGWAWVVHGRRLLIWQFKDTRHGGGGSGTHSPPRAKDFTRTPQRRGTMAQCRELTLPHCDIGHKAALISVFLSDGQQMASCLAVSPTGDVRYWPSIAHDGSSVDVTGILDGQEFDKLLEVPPQQGYLLVTTTCCLVFLQLQLVNGRHVLHHKTIRQPSGFLGGIGKKFASIIIGMNSSNDRENKLVSVQCESVKDGAVITILADRLLQRWRIANNGVVEQLLFEDAEIVRKIRDEFHQKFWNGRAESIDVVLYLLDMQINEGNIYVFAGAVNSSHTPQMHYGITTLSASSDSMRIIHFVPLKMSHFFSAGTEQDCLKFRFVICRSHMYLYNDKIIYPLNMGSDAMIDMEAEKIEFHQQDDRILSAAVCGHIPLFFSRTHGLICVTPSDFDSTDMLNISVNVPEVYSPLADYTLREQQTLSSSANENNLYMFELDPDTMYNEFKDEVSQLKAAFIYKLKRNNNMCNTILTELFRTLSETQTGLVTEAADLDRIVITIAEDLAEDIPAADPRWEQLWEESPSYKHALGSSSSLQILTQLKEKNIALRHFIEFLHSTGINNKLTAVPSTGGSVSKPTCYILSDINEKIIGAIALKSIQNKYQKIIDEAINCVMSMRKESPQGNLTAQDLFYVRVCKFQDIFFGLSEVLDTKIESQQQASSVASFIADVNAIVLSVLNEVIAFRDQCSALYLLPSDKVESYEYLPWTAMSGNVGVRDALSRFIDVAVKYGARSNVDVELKQKLYQQILELMDFILDGRKNYLDSVRDSEKYNVLQQQFGSHRRDLISILIEDSQYEFAAKLAEKYLDFHSLVVICDETNNQDRLDSYIQKYEEYDFSQFAINWHLRQNRQGEVFERFKGNQAALAQFMRDHPTLGWIQLFFNGDFERASKILFQLARNETEFVQRKKSMLSLAKLAAFASSDSDLTAQVEKINAELAVVAYQEQLSEPLLTTFGYDVENQKVLKIEEIINLFIAEENETANEYDFRQALELLSYIEEPFEPRHKIWCAAILRDNWTEYDMDSAVEYLQNLLFFKLIEICHLMDGDFENFLPTLEEFLNSTDLGNLVHNKSFKYLLKLTYEYIHDSYKKNEDMET